MFWQLTIQDRQPLVNGKTWAIKIIEPNTHNNNNNKKGSETFNPICDVMCASSKLVEAIRANLDISWNALNELFF